MDAFKCNKCKKYQDGKPVMKIHGGSFYGHWELCQPCASEIWYVLRPDLISTMSTNWDDPGNDEQDDHTSLWGGAGPDCTPEPEGVRPNQQLHTGSFHSLVN